MVDLWKAIVLDKDGLSMIPNYKLYVHGGPLDILHLKWLFRNLIEWEEYDGIRLILRVVLMRRWEIKYDWTFRRISGMWGYEGTIIS